MLAKTLRDSVHPEGLGLGWVENPNPYPAVNCPSGHWRSNHRSSPHPLSQHLLFWDRKFNTLSEHIELPKYRLQLHMEPANIHDPSWIPARINSCPTNPVPGQNQQQSSWPLSGLILSSLPPSRPCWKQVLAEPWPSSWVILGASWASQAAVFLLLLNLLVFNLFELLILQLSQPAPPPSSHIEQKVSMSMTKQSSCSSRSLSSPVCQREDQSFKPTTQSMSVRRERLKQTSESGNDSRIILLWSKSF